MAKAVIIAGLRRPATLVSAGFLLAGAGIVGNALYLQPGRHPAPLFVTRETIAERARPDGLVMAAQEGLRNAGHYTGPIDGIDGPRTRAAISAFEREAGRPETGRASRDLLAALEAALAKNETPATVGRSDAATDEVAAIQRALSKAAYGPITADGVVGRETREAIMRFQADHALPVTGAISDALVVELKAAGALDEP